MGEWRVVFPDAPVCEAKAFSLHDAQYASATVLMPFLINMRRHHHYQLIWRLCTDAKKGWSETRSSCRRL